VKRIRVGSEQELAAASCEHGHGLWSRAKREDFLADMTIRRVICSKALNHTV